MRTQRRPGRPRLDPSTNDAPKVSLRVDGDLERLIEELEGLRPEPRAELLRMALRRGLEALRPGPTSFTRSGQI